MIERVARCLEQGAQSQLRGSKKAFRSRRHLHSTFWSHGAGDINLPAWWVFLLQAREPIKAITPDQNLIPASKSMATGLQEMFFKFLYPLQTRALIRRLDCAARSHLQAARLAQQTSRTYTSLAEDLLVGKRDSEQYEQRQESEANGDLKAKEKIRVMQRLAEKLLEPLTQPGDYDELWQLQQEAFETSQTLEVGILNKLFFALSTSQRRIDHERSLALFEMMDPKSSMLYSTAVKTALGLQDADIAIDIHGEAAAKTPGTIDIGTPYILKYAIEQDQWRLAIETWYRLWHSPFVYYSVQRDLWKEVDSLSLNDKLIQTEKAVDFASSIILSASSRDGDSDHQATAIAARDFALTMAEKTFSAKGDIFTTSQYLSLLEKVKTLDKSGMKFQLQALEQILTLKDEGNLSAALPIYTELRQETSFAPSRELLAKMMTAFKILENSSGLMMIVEDWQAHFGVRLRSLDYVSIAKVIADKGSVEQMEILLGSFFNESQPTGAPQELRTRMLNSMLFMHFKRNDAQSLVRCFDDFQRLHAFVPDKLSYHFAIMAYSAQEDVKNCLSWFEKLKDSGIPLEHQSFYGLLRMFAKRGEVEAVNALLDEMDLRKMKPDLTTMIALLTVNVKNERYEDAERVVKSALPMDLYGPQTILWNILLNGHAQRGNWDKVSALHKEMYRAGVPEDSATYAALLSALGNSGSVMEARRVMLEVMPRLGIERTIFHYNSLMTGFLKNNQFGMVFHTYKHMLTDGFEPNSAINDVLLTAAAKKDKMEKRRDSEVEGFPRASAVFDAIMEQWNRIEYASRAPENESTRGRNREASFSRPYSYMIYLYGSEASFTKAAELYNSYVENGRKLGMEDSEANWSISMLTDLLRVHELAKNDDEVERYWNLILAQLAVTAKRLNANLNQPGWVLHAHRYSIDYALRIYMKHLFGRNRFEDMITVISDLDWAGYELSTSSWNYYVQYLSASPHATDRSLAFQVCEEELMQDWSGWTHYALDENNNIRGADFQRKAILRESHAARSVSEKRKVDYRTIVQLAGVHMEASSGVFGGGGGGAWGDEVMRDELQSLAPITVIAIRSMPKLQDDAQMAFLREVDR